MPAQNFSRVWTQPRSWPSWLVNASNVPALPSIVILRPKSRKFPACGPDLTQPSTTNHGLRSGDSTLSLRAAASLRNAARRVRSRVAETMPVQPTPHLAPQPGPGRTPAPATSASGQANPPAPIAFRRFSQSGKRSQFQYAVNAGINGSQPLPLLARSLRATGD